MNVRTKLILGLFSLNTLFISAQSGDKIYDVVVYGGTPGGVIAAISAYRSGATVVLLEQKRHVGGMVTSGLNTDEGYNMDRNSFSEMTWEYFERLSAKNPEKEMKPRIAYQFESSVAEEVMLEMLGKTTIDLQYGQLIKKANMSDTKIKSIEMENGMTYYGKVFVDASYEGDLMAMSNVSYTVGREGSEKYGESLAGIQYKDEIIKFSPYDKKGLLPGVIPDHGLVEGTGDAKVLSYNFRPTLTKVDRNKISIKKPKTI